MSRIVAALLLALPLAARAAERLSLDAAIAEAERASSDLAAARARLEQARAAVARAPRRVPPAAHCVRHVHAELRCGRAPAAGRVRGTRHGYADLGSGPARRADDLRGGAQPGHLGDAPGARSARRARVELQAARANVAKAEHQVSLARENQRLVEVSFRAGQAASLEATDANSALTTAGLTGVNERLAADLAALRLVRAAGL